MPTNASHSGHAYQGEDCPTCAIERAAARAFANRDAFAAARVALCRALARRGAAGAFHEHAAAAVLALVRAERVCESTPATFKALRGVAWDSALSDDERAACRAALAECARDAEERGRAPGAGHFRVTRPTRYPVGTPGASDPGSRQGFYVDAADATDAALIVRGRLSERGAGRTGSAEPLDVQPWRHNATHGHGVTVRDE